MPGWGGGACGTGPQERPLVACFVRCCAGWQVLTPCFPNNTRVHAAGNLDLDGPIYFDLKKRNSTADGKPVWQVTNVYYVSGRGEVGAQGWRGGGAGLERGGGGGQAHAKHGREARGHLERSGGSWCGSLLTDRLASPCCVCRASSSFTKPPRLPASGPPSFDVGCARCTFKLHTPAHSCRQAGLCRLYAAGHSRPCHTPMTCISCIAHPSLHTLHQSTSQ